MKRIKAACITQTIHFINKDVSGSEYSKKKVQEDNKEYYLLIPINEKSAKIYVPINYAGQR